jgi:transcriptional regulator
MYLPDAFREEDLVKIAALIRAHPLAALVALQEGELAADHLPFLFDAEKRLLRAHVARANPLWRRAAQGGAALAIFGGSEHYVTPSWYPSKRRTGKVAPTWNYEVVHVHGRLRVMDDAATALDIVEALTREHEEKRAAPWAVSDAPEDYVAMRIKAIVAIELEITRIEAKRKLSQNQSAEDRAGVVSGLREEGSAAAAEMARRMEE